MKKWLSALLALCLLMTALPALGEDLSGMWYMTLAEVTIGYLYLNEDGTAEMVVLDDEEIMTGTWTADDASVTLTLQDETVTLSLDGETLILDQLPVPFTREEGRVSMDQIINLLNEEDFELPEGMTAEEMAQIAVNFMEAFLQLSVEEEDDEEGNVVDDGEGSKDGGDVETILNSAEETTTP